MSLPRFASLCALSAAALLSACSPTPQPPAQVVVNNASGVSVERGPNGEIIISNAEPQEQEQAQEQGQTEQEVEEEVEEGELISDPTGALYRSLGNGTYERVEVVSTTETEETVEESSYVEEQECDPAPAPAAKPAAKPAKAKAKPSVASPSSSAVMVIASERDFQERVLGASEPVMVVFEQSWCGFCKRYLPTLNAAAERSSDYRIARVDIAKLPSVAQKWARGLTGTPYTVAFHSSQPLKGLSIPGQLSEAELAAMIKKAQAKASPAKNAEPAATPLAPEAPAPSTEGAADNAPSPEALPANAARRSGMSI